MGFTLNLGRIAQGAMTKYLKDDDARIAQAAKDRERKYDQDHDLKKLEISHKYRLKEDEAKAKATAISDAAVLSEADKQYHFPVDSVYSKWLRTNNFPKMYESADIAKMSSKTNLPKDKLNWYEDAAKRFNNNPDLISLSPSYSNQNLVSHILDEVAAAARVAKLGDTETDQQGKKVEGRVMLSNYPSLAKLTDRVIELGLPSASSAKALKQFFFTPMKPPTVQSEVAQKMLDIAAGQTNAFGSGSFIDGELFRKAVTAMVASGSANMLSPEQYGLGRNINTPEFKLARRTFLQKVLQEDSISPSIKTGKDTNGRYPTVSTLDLISAHIQFYTRDTSSATSYTGRTYAARVPENAVDMAKTSLRLLPDHAELVSDSDRLLQLNNKLQNLINDGKAPNIASLQLPRTIYVNIKSVIDEGISKLSNYNQIKKDILSTNTTQKRKGVSLAEVYDTRRIESELGFRPDESFLVNDGKDGFENVVIGEKISEAIKVADSRITDLKDRAKDLKGEEKSAADSFIEAEIEYAHLKIRTIFTIAKVIQGGTGGRGVSNLDFEYVAKSLRESAFSTLRNQRTIYERIREKAIRSYARTSFSSSAENYNPSVVSSMVDRTINIFSALQQLHKVREQDTNDTSSRYSGMDVGGDYDLAGELTGSGESEKERERIINSIHGG